MTRGDHCGRTGANGHPCWKRTGGTPCWQHQTKEERAAAWTCLSLSSRCEAGRCAQRASAGTRYCYVHVPDDAAPSAARAVTRGRPRLATPGTRCTTVFSSGVHCNRPAMVGGRACLLCVRRRLRCLAAPVRTEPTELDRVNTPSERCLRACPGGKPCMTRTSGGPCRHHADPPPTCATSVCGLPPVEGGRWCRVHALVMGTAVRVG
jgi:hypothetical protein